MRPSTVGIGRDAIKQLRGEIGATAVRSADRLSARGHEVKNFEPKAPGTKNEYSNMGIVVAGYLVEVISGMPFDQYCKDNIFAPLGMTKTSWRLADIDRSLLAEPYDKSSSGYVPYGQYGEPDYPDGMLRTSAVELSRFIIAYMQGGRYRGQRILKPRTVKDMLRTQTPLDSSQGLVWSSQSINGRTVWGHDGDDNGAGTKMWLDPDRRTGVILMTNGIWKDDDNACWPLCSARRTDIDPFTAAGPPIAALSLPAPTSNTGPGSLHHLLEDRNRQATVSGAAAEGAPFRLHCRSLLGGLQLYLGDGDSTARRHAERLMR